ncbi:MAG: abortive infection protein [Bacteroidetes bacterium]|nr:abortive infection protein [Bacteroidota bacterium]
MKQIIQYIIQYSKSIDKRALACISLFTALFVYINYAYGLDPYIRKKNNVAVKLLWWYVVSLAALGIPYLIQFLFRKDSLRINRTFLVLLLLAPLIFAIKLTYNPRFSFSAVSSVNNYWNQVAYWPALLVITFIFLLLIWYANDRDQPFYGLKLKHINWRPYWMMLLLMAPLIALAATQPDFQAAYPKLQSLKEIGPLSEIPVWKKVLYELSYGTDFITIEFFFRGFLVLGFIKWAGKDAILPMACFYCMVHFGKPLGECISSYFGGILLGIVVYHTRSALGGLMVHLGIAWMMEVAGYFSS